MSIEELRQRTLRLLARRDHTRAELARKLAGCGTAEEVEAVIARAGELGLQSDRRFAEQFVRSRSSRLGEPRLLSELERRGIARELAREALHNELPADELQRAREVWRAKFGSAPCDRREWARQARFLQYRGFSGEVIRRLLEEPDDEPA